MSAHAADETRARLIAETREQTARLIADTRKQTLAEEREKALEAELHAKQLVAERAYAYGFGGARLAYMNRPYYAAPTVYANGVSGLTYAAAASSPARRTVVIQQQPQPQPQRVVVQARRAPRVVVVDAAQDALSAAHLVFA
jgi:hypothetical protein